MDIEAAIRELAERELHVTQGTSGNGDADLTVQGDLGPWGGNTFYRWLCFLQQEDSFWVVWPPPHPRNDPGLAFIVSSLDDAVLLISFLYQRRVVKNSSPVLGSAEYAAQLLAETEYTRKLYNEWLASQG